MVGEVFLERLFERGVEVVLTNRNTLKAFASFATINRGTVVRVSFSELLLITSGQKYLLVLNKKRQERYGPLGGVVHYFQPARELVLDGLSFKDQLPQVDGRSDLRGTVKGRQFFRLLRWFYSGKHIEKWALAREIREELEEIGQHELAAEMPHLELDLVRVVHEGPTKIPGQDILQYRLFHIFQLESGDAATMKFGKSLLRVAARTPALLLAAKDEILKGRGKAGELIGDHAGYLFGKKRGGSGEPPAF
jgi:hypothetical protein